MILKVLLMALTFFLLSGCEIFATRSNVENKKPEVVDLSNRICVFATKQVEIAENCNIEYWISYWSQVDNLSWPQRQAELDILSESVADTLKKVLLCQGKGTPYQNRLRAQTWATSLLPEFTDEMRNFITVAVFQTSQELLEMESALVTLSKINTNQSNRVDEQQQVIEKQKNQIEQLLIIEASIMDNSKGDSQ